MSDEYTKQSGANLPPNPSSIGAEIEQVVEAGRRELPTASLADQVLAGLAQRQFDLNALSPSEGSTESRRHWRSVGTVASLIAVAAAATLVMHLRSERRPALVGAERIVATANSVRPEAPAAISVPDPCRNVVVAAGRQPTIDDFEDGDDAVLPFEGRSGLWRWVRDTDRPGTAPALLPIPQAQPKVKDKQALHVKGGPLLDWGASIEFTFQPSCYDASAYRGIKLRAKGPGRIYVATREVRLIPPEGGGTCQGSDCYNVHVKKFDLPAQYTTLSAFWFELKQRGYNRPPVDPKQLHSIALFVRPEDTPYDLWIDEVSFID